MKRPFKGSYDRCPKCRSTRVMGIPEATYTTEAGETYGPGLARCHKCGALWEAFNDADVPDDDDPLCPFVEPCNNCAFRRGSPEQANPETWAELMKAVENHHPFSCHKGVPIEVGAPHGFAYPMKKTTVVVDAKAVEIEVPNRAKLRTCRGWLNVAFAKRNMAKFEKESNDA